ncbi:MAG: DUF1697 domain-containing protein [Pseudomonadota bacterium]
MDRPRWIGLIRGIGPTTHAKMSMQSLRERCEEAGLTDVRTLLATGNLICTSPLAREAVQARIEAVIRDHGLEKNPVVMRTPAEIAATMAACPFKEAAEARPSKLLIAYLDGPAPDGVEDMLAEYGPEPVKAVGDVVYIDYSDGVATSKLTPDRLARVTGHVVTARNWTTSGKLAAL